MKRGILVLVVLFFISIVSAANPSCSLSVSLLNQDPYPAVPGEYVKLVFQVDGLSDPSCGMVTFELLNQYPLIFDPNQSTITTINSGTFAQDFSSHYLATYKVRVDSLAVDGENPIKVRYANSQSSSSLSKEFNLTTGDIRASFEVYVKNFDFTVNDINLEVLNVGKSKVEAVTLELKDSANLTVKGPNTKIIGDLDSNEYTTADFEVSPVKSIIPITIHYTDSAGIRRTTESSVSFNPEFFIGRKADQKSSSKTPWIIGIIILAAIVYFWNKRRKKKRN